MHQGVLKSTAREVGEVFRISRRVIARFVIVQLLFSIVASVAACYFMDLIFSTPTGESHMNYITLSVSTFLGGMSASFFSLGFTDLRFTRGGLTKRGVGLGLESDLGTVHSVQIQKANAWRSFITGSKFYAEVKVSTLRIPMRIQMDWYEKPVQLRQHLEELEQGFQQSLDVTLPAKA